MTDKKTIRGPVKIALVGAGGIAKTHAKAAAAISESMRIVAAVDPREEARAAFVDAADVPFYSSVAALIEAKASGEVEIDGIVLCAPPSVRADVVGPALEAGLHVLVEKPIGRTAEEAAALVAMAKANPGLVTAVGYCHRFTPGLVEMRRQIREGTIGRPTRFENVFAFHHPPMAEAWFSDPVVSGGGSFVDTGCHSLDLFHFLIGPPEAAGAVGDYDWEGRGDSSSTVVVRAASGDYAGTAGVILSGWLEAPRFQVRVVGTEGSLSFDFDYAETLTHTTPSGDAKGLVVGHHEFRFQRQLEAFAGAVREGRTAADAGLATFGDGAIVAKAVDSVHEKLRLYNNASVSRLSLPGAV